MPRSVGPRWATVLEVKVKAPTPQVAEVVHRKFDPLVNKPVDTNKVQALLARTSARTGATARTYTVGHDSAGIEPAHSCW